MQKKNLASIHLYLKLFTILDMLKSYFKVFYFVKVTYSRISENPGILEQFGIWDILKTTWNFKQFLHVFSFIFDRMVWSTFVFSFSLSFSFYMYCGKVVASTCFTCLKLNLCFVQLSFKDKSLVNIENNVFFSVFTVSL